MTLRDKAGNVSAPYQVSYTTKPAPILTSYSLNDPGCTVATSGKLVLPFIGNHVISSDWGTRPDPYTNAPGDYHEGIDYKMDIGTQVLAAGNGVVQGVFWDTVGGGGNMVTIDHGNGVITWYAHLSQQLTKVGATVVPGTLIGLSGASGKVTGPHLHFQVNLNRVNQNPNNYLFKCEKLPNQNLSEGVSDLPEAFRGNAFDPYNGKTYADILKYDNLKNYINVFQDEAGNITSATPSDTRSYISYIDIQTSKIVLSGFAPPSKSTWTYRITQQLATNQCVNSITVCGNKRITEKEVVNSSVTTTISIVDLRELRSYKGTGPIPKSYSEVVNVDANGKWSMTFYKIADNQYKADNSSFVISTAGSGGFSFAAMKNISFNSSEFTDKIKSSVVKIIDANSNIFTKAPDEIVRSNPFNQNINVTGDWDKDPGTYFSDSNLNLRTIQLITKNDPTQSPDVINLFIHGWEKAPPSASLHSGSIFDSWVAYDDGSQFIKMADTQNANDIQLNIHSLNVAVSWRDASYEKFNILKPSPTQAARWTVPVARVIAEKLAKYIIDYKINPTINCTGHSLGSYLCNEIGSNLKIYLKEPIVRKIVALDPASDANPFDHYKLNGYNNNDTDFTNYFSKNYVLSTAYFGFGSLCGNEYYARTAGINIGMMFNGVVDSTKDLNVETKCILHGKVVDAYLNMMKSSHKLILPDVKNGFGTPVPLMEVNKGNYTGRSNIVGISDIDFAIYMAGADTTDIKFVIRKDNNSVSNIYGTWLNDEFPISMDFLPSMERNYRIVNFGTEDRIKYPVNSIISPSVLPNGDVRIFDNISGNYLILLNNSNLDGLKNNLNMYNSNYFTK